MMTLPIDNHNSKFVLQLSFEEKFKLTPLQSQVTFRPRFSWLLVVVGVLLAVSVAPATAQEDSTTPATPTNDSNNSSKSANRHDSNGPNKVPVIQIQPTISERTKYIIIGCVVGFLAAVVGVLLIMACSKVRRRLQQPSDSDKIRDLPDQMEQAEYPRKFSQTSVSGDRKLAQSAQMYHFQHQKQQLIAMESAQRTDATSTHTLSDPDLDEDDTVYECPGLANFQSAGTMEVKNPMFDSAIDSNAMTPEQRQSPASPPEKVSIPPSIPILPDE